MEKIQKLTNLQIFFLLLLVGSFIHISIFFNGFVGDDVSQIYNVGIVKGILDLPKVFLFHHVVLGEPSLLGAYYKPLMLFYFYFIRSVFGFNPFFYHTPQVFLIVINAFLTFLFFSKFFKKHIALILSVIFLIHPINQETAAYASNIQDVLFFLFGMSALLIGMRKKITARNYVIIFLLLLLSLLSKETGILFLFAFLIYTTLFKQKLLIKHILISAGALAIYFVFRLFSSGTNVFWIEPPPMAALSFRERIMHIPIVFYYYIQTFFYPITLTFNQQWIIKTFDATTFGLPLFADSFFILILLICMWLLFKKGEENKKTFVFFFLWFFLGIIPHLQILPLDATVATRWFYFSSIGALGMAGVGYEIIERRSRQTATILFILTILACATLGMRTMIRNTEWKDAFTLYSHDARIAKSALIENNLGDEYFKKNDYKNAEIHFKNALIINPDLWIAINNLGILAEQKKDLKTAYSYYDKALKEGDRLPIRENMARVLVLRKKYTEATQFINKSLHIYPLSANLYLILALTYFEQGKYKEALINAKKSYELLNDPKTENVIRAINERVAQ